MTIKIFLLVITCVTIGALAQLAMKMGMSGPAVQATLAGGIGANALWAVMRNPLSSEVSLLILLVLASGFLFYQKLT